jgi:hypothetical protein
MRLMAAHPHAIRALLAATLCVFHPSHAHPEKPMPSSATATGIAFYARANLYSLPIRPELPIGEAEAEAARAHYRFSMEGTRIRWAEKWLAERSPVAVDAQWTLRLAPGIHSMPLDIAPFQARRTRLLATMQAAGGGVAIIPTAPERLRNRDTHYGYRFDSYFYYLTGFPSRGAVLVLVAGDTPRSMLFCRERHGEREIWDGYRFGPDAARETFGFDEAHPIAELDEKLAELLANQPASSTRWVTKTGLGQPHRRAPSTAVRAQAAHGLHAPAEIRDVRA